MFFYIHETARSNSVNTFGRKESVICRRVGAFPRGTVITQQKHEDVQGSDLKPTRLKKIRALSLTPHIC